MISLDSHHLENRMKNQNGTGKDQTKLAKFFLVNYRMRRTSYYLRGFAGVYLVYLAWKLLDQILTQASAVSAVNVGGMIFMAAAGVYFAVSSVYAVTLHIYEEALPDEDDLQDNTIPDAGDSDTSQEKDTEQ